MRRAFSSITRGLDHYQQICSSYSIARDMLNVPHTTQPDHVAWRSFRSAGGIQNIETVLAEEGYVPAKHYDFRGLNVRATHFEHTEQPLVFASEFDDASLQGVDLRSALQLLLKPVKQMRWDGSSTGTLLWGAPDYKVFLELEKQSAYAAWSYVFGNTLNHATIDCGEALTQCVNVVGSRLTLNRNAAGNTIHVSHDGLLHQASTAADFVDVMWSDGEVRAIPGPFVEFIQRIRDPATGEPKRGFEPENAARIFTSTDRVPLTRRHD